MSGLINEFYNLVDLPTSDYKLLDFVLLSNGITYEVRLCIVDLKFAVHSLQNTLVCNMFAITTQAA